MYNTLVTFGTLNIVSGYWQIKSQIQSCFMANVVLLDKEMYADDNVA